MIGDAPVAPRIDWRATERQARQVLEDWRGALLRQPEQRRPFLREWLAGEPIRFAPIDESTRRGYRFEGSAVIGGLFEGLGTRRRKTHQWKLASPPGFEPGFQP